jgi:hypothetical protein
MQIPERMVWRLNRFIRFAQRLRAIRGIQTAIETIESKSGSTVEPVDRA